MSPIPSSKFTLYRYNQVNAECCFTKRRKGGEKGEYFNLIHNVKCRKYFKRNYFLMEIRLQDVNSKSVEIWRPL